MPLLTPRQPPERRRLRGAGLRQRAPRPRHHGRPAPSSPGCCASTTSACASTWCSTTSRASTPGPSGRGRATRATAPTSTCTTTAPRPDDYERTLPEVFPDFAPGNFTWDDELRRLGLDDVQRLPVGRQLVEPRRALRVRRDHPQPGQPRRRGAPARRDRVHLEADGHRLPEPARGARADPGAPHGHADRRPGDVVQGRGDRRPAGPAGLPRTGRAPRQGQRSRLPQQPDGADLVDAGQPRRRPRGVLPAAARRRRRAPPPGSPTRAATTTSAGPSTTTARPRSGSAATRTGSSSRTSTPATSPGRGRADWSSRRTR